MSGLVGKFELYTPRSCCLVDFDSSRCAGIGFAPGICTGINECGHLSNCVSSPQTYLKGNNTGIGRIL